jgi:hypothetical protein
MGDLYEQIRDLARRYIDENISIEDFRVAFAGLYFRARQSARRDARANSLASRIIGPLAEFSRGHRDEQSLRRELATAIRPFAASGILANPFQAATPLHCGGTVVVHTVYMDQNAGAQSRNGGRIGIEYTQPDRIPVQTETRTSSGWRSLWSVPNRENMELPSYLTSGNSSTPQLGLAARASA